MTPINLMRADWDRRAHEDPYYYVAFAQRGQSVGEFLATAAENIGAFESQLCRLPPRSAEPVRALEVGCGPGRLLLPMSTHFDEIHGVDISPQMVQLARDTLKNVSHAHVHLTEHSDLRMFGSDHFDFVYSYAVFQHIPAKEIVLNYVCEIRRVLKPGGITCCHFRGSPPLASEHHEPATWTGCFFVLEDVKKLVIQNELQLVNISGLDTQYMMVTMRRPMPKGNGAVCSPGLLAVTWAAGTGQRVPRRGRTAAISLWMSDLPADASLLDFEIQCGGYIGWPYFISSPSESNGYQINARLPQGLAGEKVAVGVTFRDAAIGKRFEIELTDPVDSFPTIAAIADAVDVGSRRIQGDSLKVWIENVVDPLTALFIVDGQPAQSFEFDFVDPILSEYEFCVRFAHLPTGERSLSGSIDGVKLAPLTFAVDRS